MSRISIETREEKETGRIEAFSDGVFAIAITLLILEIKVPEPDTIDSPEALWQALSGGLIYSYLAFFTSFVVIGVMWINHHRIFTYVRRTDQALLFYNTLLLLGITFVPFPTAVLGKYLEDVPAGSANVAAIFYAGTGLGIAIFFNLLWRHIAYWGRLMGKDTPPGYIDNITKSYRFGPLFYVVAMGVAVINGQASFVYSMLLAIYFALPVRR